jgi:hypothetical protein
MTSQEQCDRMRQVCIDNGLPIWEVKVAFELLKIDKKAVFCFISNEQFYVLDFYDFSANSKELRFTQVSETEFLELLKEYKDENN